MPQFDVLRFVAASLVAVSVIMTMRRPAGVDHPCLVRGVATVAPSLVASAAIVRLAPPSSTWYAVAQIICLGAGGFAIWALMTLGRCFGFIPNRRGLVTRGPYRIVRHPAYLGELGVVLVAASQALGDPLGTWHNLVVGLLVVASIVGVVIRITAEEHTLTLDGRWADYRNVTRFRLVPFVW